MRHDPALDDNRGRVWGPYAITAAAAGMGWVLRLTAGGTGLAVFAGLLLVPPIVLAVAHARGRHPLSRGQLVYTAGCLVGLACWVAAAGTAAWPHAALVAAAAAGAAAGWRLYGLGGRPAPLATAIGIATAVLAGLLLGVTRQPNPARWALVWLTATTFAATPWWTWRHKDRQTPPPSAVSELQLLTGALVKHLGHRVEVVPESLSLREDGRYSVRYRLADGRIARHVLGVVEAVESELGWRPGALQVDGSRTRRDEVTITVVPDDPASRPLAAAPLPTSILQPAVIGYHDTGEPIPLHVYTEEGARHGLTGGRTGSGKTREVWTELKAFTHARDTVFCFADLSGGSSSAPWEPCLLWRETSTDGALMMINALTAAATARAAVLAERGWESWQPSPQHPAIVFYLDEAQQLLKDSYAAQAALAKLMQIARKSGIRVEVVCPDPVQMEGVTPVMRKMAVIRRCFAMPGSSTLWALQGTPAELVAGAVAEFTKPGQVLVSAPEVKPLPGRGLDTPLADAKAAAVSHAAYRPPLDPLTDTAMRHAAGDAYPADGPPDPQQQARDTWTDADDRALRKATTVSDEQLRDRLRRLAEQPDVLGQPWPHRPPVPPIPKGRLTTEQALQVAKEMLAQPGGTTPAAVVRATGRSRSWAFDVLGRWVDDGVAEQTVDRRYVVAAAHLVPPDDSD